jgi:hypothetical protein
MLINKKEEKQIDISFSTIRTEIDVIYYEKKNKIFSITVYFLRSL